MIAVIIDNKHTKRLLINKDGIYHIQKGHRLFLPWSELLSVEYDFSISMQRGCSLRYNLFRGYTPYGVEYLRIVTKNTKKRNKFRPIEKDTYFWNLIDFYPSQRRGSKYNEELEMCLSYYCKLHGINY